MLTKVREWITKHNIIVEGDNVLVACSGGPDSLALLHILRALCSEYNISIFAAHVDHMFRGAESAEEAKFVVDFCQKRGIKCYHTAIDVPEFIRQTHLSEEEAARFIRYQYLRQIAEELGGAKIATGHHRDDQAETVLINVLRGAGSVGIRGIQPIHGDVIRPLLCLTRAEIIRYCEKQQLEPRFDSSNLETKYLRNRIRLKLLPELEQQYNGAVKDALCRMATIVGEEHDFIRITAENMWPQLVVEEDNQLFFDTKKMEKIHLAVLREIFRLGIEKKQGNLTGISFFHVETLVELLTNGQVGSIIQLPGSLLACKSYNGVYLRSKSFSTEKKVEYAGQDIVVPGTTSIPELGIMLCTEVVDTKSSPSQRNIGVFDWLALAKPLHIRIRLAGDKFQPMGLHGTKKLKDFFIDEKVPRETRNLVPIICDQNDIIWVGGYRQSNVGQVTEKTKEILQIRIIKLQQKKIK